MADRDSPELKRPSWFLLGALIAAFAVALVAAGHGLGPIGLLLVLGWGYWTAPVVVGWAAILLLVVGRAGSSSTGSILHRLGGILSLASWALFLSMAEVPSVTMVTSIPYLALLAVWAARVWMRMEPSA